MSRKCKIGSRNQRFKVEKERRSQRSTVAGSFMTGNSSTSSFELDLKSNIVTDPPHWIFCSPTPHLLSGSGFRPLQDVSRCLLHIGLHLLQVGPYFLYGLASHLLDQLPSVLVTNCLELLLLLGIEERS